MNYYLGIDIGASSGRHIIGWMEDGKMKYREIHRFENRNIEKDGHLYWDVDHLWNEVLNGMKKCRECGMIPKTVSIDSFAVDYVLLDENDQPITPVYAYRDSRTFKIMEEVRRLIPDEELYQINGIQLKNFNTMYQLCDDQKNGRLDKAKCMLMLPDYLQYKLSGVKSSEYTNATSTGLIDPDTFDWNKDLIARLGLSEHIFLPLAEPGSAVGTLSEHVREYVGFDCMVVHCASHDTASAVVACPVKDNGIYISSGTWSLMGVESLNANRSEGSYRYNFTNEGGIDHRYRHLKNIMGLWMIQCVRHELDDRYSFGDLAQMAAQNMDYDTIVDVNDDLFLAPSSMIDAIGGYCRDHNLKAPASIGEICMLIYRSLACSYRDCVKQLEEVNGKKYEEIYVIGGGSNVDMLNRMIAQMTGLTVYAGIGEATALGNIAVQMLYDGQLKSLKDIRDVIRTSFGLTQYKKDI